MEPVFKEKLTILVNEQIHRQAEENQDQIRYLYLCRLISSGYTGSNEVIMGLSNSMLYLDENRSETFWHPQQIHAEIEQDMKEAEKQLRRKYVRLQEYEFFHIRKRLLCDDWGLLKQSFIRLIQKQKGLLFESPLLIENELLVLCGDYMEQLEINCCVSSEGRNHE